MIDILSFFYGPLLEPRAKQGNFPLTRPKNPLKYFYMLNYLPFSNIRAEKQINNFPIFTINKPKYNK